MTDNQENIELLRAEGRAQACEGIMRSRFGQRACVAGSKALHKLHIQESGALRGHWVRSISFRIGAAAVAAAALIIILLYAFGGPEGPKQPVVPDNQALQHLKRERGRNIPGKTMPARGSSQDKLVKKQKPEGKTDEEKPAPAPEQQEAVVLARIGELSGEIRVKRQDSGEWLEPGILFNILPGDTVKASSPGQARLDMESGDSLYLNSEAQVTVGKDAGEVLFMLESGEIYIEKESVEGAMTVDTGYGRMSSRHGRFHMNRLSKDECLLHVLEGEVECREKNGNYSRKYKDRVRTCFRRGEHCEEGRKFDSEEEFKWAMRMRSRRRPPHRGRGRGPGKRGRGPFPGEGRFGPSKSGPTRFFSTLVEGFDKLDANGDGRLSADEINAPDKEMCKKLIEQLDTDGDGGLSLEECKAVLEKMKERKGHPGSGRHGPEGLRGERSGPDNDE